MAQPNRLFCKAPDKTSGDFEEDKQMKLKEAIQSANLHSATTHARAKADAVEGLTTYLCSGMRNVKAEDMREAARIFADRMARRKFGKRGIAFSPKMGAYDPRMRFAEFTAFIGYKSGQSETTGSDLHFTVSIA